MEMERPRVGSPMRLKTNLLCMPRLKNTSSSTTSHGKAAAKGSSPMAALLERLREAVFRLIMLSALSSAAAGGGGGRGHVAAGNRRCDNDHRRSEAVADCIEFIKRKAGPEDEIGSGSTASSSSEGVATPSHQLL